MTYEEGKAMVRASSSFEGVNPVAIADILSGALSPLRMRPDDRLDLADVKTAAAAAYELGRLGLGRESFMGFLR